MFLSDLYIYGLENLLGNDQQAADNTLIVDNLL